MTSTRYWDELPAALSALDFEAGPGSVLVYDSVLEERFGGFLSLFPSRYRVSGGEGLKDLAAFPGRAVELLDLVGSSARGDITIVAAGGGSVGDFGGFMASVLKRGVDLIHVPTTWLAAMDSAHGGKTALNVGGVKNQIGTFHPASQVWIFKPLLDAVPEPERLTACGELLKMAMLAGGDLFEGVVAVRSFDSEELWALLPRVVAAKENVVREDPTEGGGRRQVLNLGHTVGHVLEAHHGLAHGQAVGQGLRFTLEWSAHRGYLSATEARQLMSLLDRFEVFDRGDLPAIPEERFRSLLDQDKKSQGPGRVHFVFLQGVGSPLLEGVSVDEVVEEAGRQGWV